VINATGANYSVSMPNEQITINSLTTNSANLTLQLGAGILTLDNDSSATFRTFNLSGATIQGAGDLSLHGTINWTAGGFLGTGDLNLLAGSTTSISNPERPERAI
jgi:hypothetical protein